MNFYEIFLHKQTSKQTKNLSPYVHAKSLPPKTMTFTLKMALRNNYCVTVFQVSMKSPKYGFHACNLFHEKKNTVRIYTVQPSLKYFLTFTMVNKFYVNKLLVNKQQEYTRK